MKICQRYPEDYTEPTRSWVDPSLCIQGTHWEGKVSVPTDTAEIAELIDKFREHLFQNWHQIASIEGLEKEILLLKNRCDYLERNAPVTVLIESFAPEPYEIIKPFHVTIKFQEEQYIASFFDTNLSASGDTQEESFANLKDIIVGTFEIFTTMDDDKLGPGPLHQKRLLVEFIRKKP